MPIFFTKALDFKFFFDIIATVVCSTKLQIVSKMYVYA